MTLSNIQPFIKSEGQYLKQWSASKKKNKAQVQWRLSLKIRNSATYIKYKFSFNTVHHRRSAKPGSPCRVEPQLGR
jgi:hypothetical protein